MKIKMVQGWRRRNEFVQNEENQRIPAEEKDASNISSIKKKEKIKKQGVPSETLPRIEIDVDLALETLYLPEGVSYDMLPHETKEELRRRVPNECRKGLQVVLCPICKTSGDHLRLRYFNNRHIRGQLQARFRCDHPTICKRIEFTIPQGGGPSSLDKNSIIQLKKRGLLPCDYVNPKLPRAKKAKKPCSTAPSTSNGTTKCAKASASKRTTKRAVGEDDAGHFASEDSIVEYTSSWQGTSAFSEEDSRDFRRYGGSGKQQSQKKKPMKVGRQDHEGRFARSRLVEQYGEEQNFMQTEAEKVEKWERDVCNKANDGRQSRKTGKLATSVEYTPSSSEMSASPEEESRKRPRLGRQYGSGKQLLQIKKAAKVARGSSARSGLGEQCYGEERESMQMDAEEVKDWEGGDGCNKRRTNQYGRKKKTALLKVARQNADEGTSFARPKLVEHGVMKEQLESSMQVGEEEDGVNRESVDEYDSEEEEEEVEEDEQYEYRDGADESDIEEEEEEEYINGKGAKGHDDKAAVQHVRARLSDLAGALKKVKKLEANDPWFCKPMNREVVGRSLGPPRFVTLLPELDDLKRSIFGLGLN